MELRGPTPEVNTRASVRLGELWGWGGVCWDQRLEPWFREGYRFRAHGGGGQGRGRSGHVQPCPWLPWSEVGVE